MTVVQVQESTTGIHYSSMDLSSCLRTAADDLEGREVLSASLSIDRYTKHIKTGAHPWLLIANIKGWA